jgi:hypothetical protein
MTEETARAAPHALVERVAQELVEDGYEAIVQPAPYLLPADIARFRPDILARRHGENVAVAVREIPDATSGPQVRGLAEAVRSHPGWHFRLTTAPREEPVAPWEPTEAEARVREAEELLERGHPEAALVLLLAAAEAVGRWLAAQEQLKLTRWDPRALFSGLVHHGLIDQADARLLDRARQIRNLVIHGARGEAGADVDVPALIGVARRLLAEVEISRAELSAPAPPSAAE